MKTGRNVHVPKTPQMKQSYRRYIETLDYEPTVDERMNFRQSSQSGEELSATDTKKRRPISTSDKIRDHFSKNWVIWILGALATGILFLISDSKVAFTKFETLLSTQNDKLSDLKKMGETNQKIDHSQDLRIQENSIMVRDLKNDVTEVDSKLEKLINPRHNASR